jgi:hypothetical protein
MNRIERVLMMSLSDCWYAVARWLRGFLPARDPRADAIDKLLEEQREHEIAAYTAKMMGPQGQEDFIFHWREVQRCQRDIARLDAGHPLESWD